VLYNLKSYRKAAGMSQEELANTTGIPLGSIRDWEQLKTYPQDGSRLIEIAKALRCTTDELLGRYDYSDSPFVEVPAYLTYPFGMSKDDELEGFGFFVPKSAVDRTGAPSNNNCFMLQNNHDCIDKIIPKDAYVLIDPNKRAIEGGLVYAVFINGKDAELWHVQTIKGGYALVPYSNNSKYKVKTLYNDSEDSLIVLGEAIWYSMDPNSSLRGFVSSILPDGAMRPTATDAVHVPLFGSIAAGDAIEMIEGDDTFPVPRELAERYPNGFLLKVVGESMNRVLPNLSYAFVNPTQDVVSGRIYAVNVNGYDATVKRVRKLNNGFELIPDSTDPTYKTELYDYGRAETDAVRIIGRVVYYVLPLDFEL
jgi:repressor LexA